MAEINMEIEISGFIEFCKFLALNPKEISQDKHLQELLDFCFSSIFNCKCDGTTHDKSIEIEFSQKLKALSEDQIKKLAQLFDKNGIYSHIHLSSPESETKIQLK
jgi:hypothetical protein